MAVTRAKSYRLSPSSLSIFLNCPRCFWLDKNQGISRPRGIFPSLPGGMDRIIKDYFDEYRRKGQLPPDLQGPDFEGVRLFQDQTLLERWRNWRTGLSFRDEEGHTLMGAVDDVLEKDKQVIPFDYKTKGSPTTLEDAKKYYQHQLDIYALLLDANGYKTAGFSFLLYYSPGRCQEKGNVKFDVKPIRLETDIHRARKLFRDALELLKGDLPGAAPNCEYCAWLRKAQLQ